jgi:hypothetical protein
LGIILHPPRKVLLHRLVPCGAVLGVALNHPHKISLRPVLVPTSLVGKVHMCASASCANLFVLPTDDPLLTGNDSVVLPQNDLSCAALPYEAMVGEAWLLNQAVRLFSEKYVDIFCLTHRVWVKGCAVSAAIAWNCL